MEQSNEKKLQIIAKSESLHLEERAARLFVNHPKACYFSWWLLTILLTFIVVMAGWFKIDEITGYDWIVSDTIESERYDAMNDAVDSFEDEGSAVSTRSKPFVISGLQVIIEWSDENRQEDILNPLTLKHLCEFERVMISHPDFPKFCVTNSANGTNSKCKAQFASDLTPWFYPSETERKDCNLIDLSAFNTAKETFLTANTSSAAFFFDATFRSTGNLVRTRSMISLGGPLGSDTDPNGKSYKELPTDLNGDQAAVYKAFLTNVEKSLFDANGLTGSFFSSPYNIDGIHFGPQGEIRIRYHNFFFRENQFIELISSDQILVSVSALLVGLLVFIHVRSLWVTINAIMAISFSIPVALFIYAGILQIHYFNNIHIVALFLVLGIGADNLFVLMDTFRTSRTLWVHMRGFQTQDEAVAANVYGTNDRVKEVLIARLAYSLKRTAAAVFNTSVTTFVAFMASGISPVSPVAGFGYFAALAVLVNYIWTLTMFPAFLVMRINYFDGRPFCCACIRQQVSPILEECDEESLTKQPEQEDSFEEKVFTQAYVPVLLREVSVGGFKIRIFAWGSVLALVIFACVMGSFAVKLTTPAEEDEAFGDRHMFTGFTTDFNKFSGGDDGFAEPFLVFGISGIDRSEFKRFNPSENRGAAIYDSNFDIAPEESQTFLLHVCDSLNNLQCAPDGSDETYEACVDPEGRLVTSMSCTIRDFHEWHASNYPNETPAIKLGEEDKVLFLTRLDDFARSTQKRSEIGMTNSSGQLHLLYFRMRYTTSLRTFQPEQIKGPILSLLDKWYAQVYKQVPMQLSSFYQTNIDMVWIQTERGIASGMFQGLAIGLACAFLVMFVSTGNIILAFFALGGIISIVAFVLATAQLLGWSLGIGEAIAALMVVGLSVDYVLHLGKVFSHCIEEGLYKKTDRFAYTAKVMGPTVLAAAATTALSSSVMFFTQVAFFSKMATLIVLTIVGSFLYSLFFFMPLCLVSLPLDNPLFGDVVYHFKRFIGRRPPFEAPTP